MAPGAHTGSEPVMGVGALPWGGGGTDNDAEAIGGGPAWGGAESGGAECGLGVVPAPRLAGIW